MANNSLDAAALTESSKDSPSQQPMLDVQQPTSDSYQRLTRALSTFRRYSSASETPGDWLNANLVQIEQILRSHLCHADFTDAQTQTIGNVLYQVGDVSWKDVEHEIFTVLAEAHHIDM